MRKNVHRKIVLAVTLETQSEETLQDLASLVREQLHGHRTLQLMEPRVRVASVTETTTYDASIGGKRGHKGSASDDHGHG